MKSDEWYDPLKGESTVYDQLARSEERRKQNELRKELERDIYKTRERIRSYDREARGLAQGAYRERDRDYTRGKGLMFGSEAMRRRIEEEDTQLIELMEKLRSI